MDQNFLTDPLLCLLSFLLLALWGAARWGEGRTGNSRGFQTAAETLLRVVCGLLLVFASRDKIGDAATFAGMISNYQILTPFLVPLASVVVPWLEFFAGLCLLFGLRTGGAALLYCALMGLYAAFIAFDLIRGVDINCGCGLTNPSEMATWWSVGRDLLFLAMGLVVLVSPRTFASWDPPQDPTPPR
jgi:uncharacterized membrane protein YphA (DoxX/SURF4 family)